MGQDTGFVASARAHLYKGERLVGSVGSSADHLREWCRFRLLKPCIHPCAGEMRELSPKKQKNQTSFSLQSGI